MRPCDSGHGSITGTGRPVHVGKPVARRTEEKGFPRDGKSDPEFRSRDFADAALLSISHDGSDPAQGGSRWKRAFTRVDRHSRAVVRLGSRFLDLKFHGFQNTVASPAALRPGGRLDAYGQQAGGPSMLRASRGGSAWKRCAEGHRCYLAYQSRDDGSRRYRHQRRLPRRGAEACSARA